jgi:hypothetical protein
MYNDELSGLVAQLKKYTLYLSTISIMLVLLLLLDVIGFFILLYYYNYAMTSRFGGFILQITLVDMIFGVIGILLFAFFRNNGMIIYEEIADEVEWKYNKAGERVPIVTRMQIKRFLKVRDLFMTNGVYGQFIYFMLFLLFPVLYLIFMKF